MYRGRGRGGSRGGGRSQVRSSNTVSIARQKGSSSYAVREKATRSMSELSSLTDIATADLTGLDVHLESSLLKVNVHKIKCLCHIIISACMIAYGAWACDFDHATPSLLQVAPPMKSSIISLWSDYNHGKKLVWLTYNPLAMDNILFNRFSPIFCGMMNYMWSVCVYTVLFQEACDITCTLSFYCSI